MIGFKLGFSRGFRHQPRGLLIPLAAEKAGSCEYLLQLKSAGVSLAALVLRASTQDHDIAPILELERSSSCRTSSRNYLKYCRFADYRPVGQHYCLRFGELVLSYQRLSTRLLIPSSRVGFLPHSLATRIHCCSLLWAAI